jgi:hypothetical protein
MRRLSILALATLAIACSGNGTAPPPDNSIALEQAIAEFSAMGIRCVRREPPPFHACDGLDSGAACIVPDDGESGICRLLRDGRLVCTEVENDECEQHDDDQGGDHRPHGDGGDRCDAGTPPATDGGFPNDGGLPTDGGVPTDGGLPSDGGLPADGGLAGDGGLPVDGGLPTDGGLLRDGGLGDGGLVDGGLATGPGPWINGGPLSPVERAIDACVNHMLNDTCSFHFHEQAIDGICRNVPGLGVLVCAPACSHR